MTLLRLLFVWIFVALLPQICVAQQWQVSLVDSFPKIGAAVKIGKGAAIDTDFQNNIFVLDRGNHQLLKFGLDGKLLDQIGGFGRGNDGFDNPSDLVANTSLDVFVADYFNRRVVRFDKNLNFLSQLTSELDPPYDFDRVLSVAVSPQYDLFLLEDRDNRIIKFNRFSEATAVLGGMDDPYAQLLEPTDLALDANLQLYVADPGQQAIVVFDYLGNYLRKIEHPAFEQPRAISFDSKDNLLITDTAKRCIFVFEKGLRFSGIIDVGLLQRDITGAVKINAEKQKKQYVVVLGNNRCFLLEVTQTSP